MDALKKHVEAMPDLIAALNQEKKHLTQVNQQLKRDIVEEQRRHNATIATAEQNAHKVRQENDKLTKELEQLKLRQSEAAGNVQQRGSYGSSSKEQELSDKLQRTGKDLEDTRRELAETKARLSKQMGHKLTDVDPDIADLSDKNRPTKLAERYSELYDNEWTNAFEIIDRGNEETTVKKLLQIVLNMFAFCQKESVDQMAAIQEAFMVTGEGIVRHVMQLKDCRKALADTSAKHICEKYLQDLRDSYSDTAKSALSVKEFVQECVEITWFMSIQDPPLVFGKVPRHGDTYNTDVYRAYTSSGSTVDFIVWPALLLHENGPVLCKGVAQGCGETKRERLKQDHLERPRTAADDKTLYNKYNKYRPEDYNYQQRNKSTSYETKTAQTRQDHLERPKTADDKTLSSTYRSGDYNYQQTYKSPSYETKTVQTRHVREDNSRRQVNEPSAYRDYEKVTPYEHKPATYEQITTASGKRYDNPTQHDNPTQYEMDRFLCYSKKYENDTGMVKALVGEETYEKCTRVLKGIIHACTTTFVEK